MSRDLRYDVLVDTDRVDAILAQWRRERPDLDLSGMALIGRISRLERAVRPLLDAVFAEHGLESWEFDVLATLRRSGKPYQLTAGQLLQSMMVTSGAVTNRIDRLEARGLIERRKDPSDGRLVLVALTPAGLERVDAAVAAHAANEARLVSGLPPAQRKALERLLRRLHAVVTSAAPRP
jgi:DNA-binding MarR family transcriptional regulator